MSAPTQDHDAIAEALAGLQASRPTAEILALVDHLAPGAPRFGEALFVRGVCAGRDGRWTAAKDLLLQAIEAGEQSRRVWVNLARATAEAGFPADAAGLLIKAVTRVPSVHLLPFIGEMLRAMGLVDKVASERKNAALERLLAPWLAVLLERREMDAAIALESLLYEHFIKPKETEDHFAWCMRQLEPLFTKAGRQWRAELPPLPAPALAPPYRVGFFIHNATMLAHIEVLLNTLKGYRMLDDQPFEPIVYCFGGRSAEMEAALAKLDVRLVKLDQSSPDAQGSPWARLLRLRELLAQDGVQELVWVSLVTMLPLAFGLRVAPVQTWWAMKYRNFTQPDIDGYVTGSALTKFGQMAGRRWRMARLGVDDWYDPALEEPARALRASLGEGLVLTTLARTEKMRDRSYLAAVVRILRERPQALFVWAGREEDPQVVQAFRDGGVMAQTRFVGWVNTRLYAQVADVFLDAFPFPCGFTLFQAMAAGKAAVLYDSPEAAQTGLWNFLKPLLDGDEGEPEERAELRAIMGEADDPLIAVARSPEDYVRWACRLIDEPVARAAAGAASRRLMQRYFSDPRVLGASMAEHFMDLIEERRQGA